MTSNVGWLGALTLVLTAGCGDDASSGSGSGETGSGGAAAGPGVTQGAGDPTSTSGGQGGDGSVTGTTTGQGAGPGSGGGAPGDWTPLITGSWELGTGEELTSALFTVTVDRDIFVGAIRPIAPTGTHHTVLALNDMGSGNYLYASGVDTNELVFPEGIGLKIPAGETVVLQLHVYNPTPDPLSGISGIEIIELDEADVVEQAEIFLPGPVDLQIPAQQEHSERSTCTVNAPQTLFALFPHMHQLGSHFRTTLNIGGESVTLHDAPYEFEHQPFLGFEPIELAAGDSIETECTWINTTNAEVGWGESSTAEMCFSILYRWPVLDGNGFCF